MLEIGRILTKSKYKEISVKAEFEESPTPEEIKQISEVIVKATNEIEKIMEGGASLPQNR